ncbi:MAG TPA: twin-arginine translocase TatA/TatE family subunit [Actinomycetota bacterium]|jgi:Tat protein translocase TatB subunit
MLNIGPLELLLIFLIALIVVGPKKLPDLGRTIGRGMREFRKAQDEVRQSLQFDELRDVKRDIADTQRGVREALRFDSAKPRGEGTVPNGDAVPETTPPASATPATPPSSGAAEPPAVPDGPEATQDPPTEAE